MVGMTKEYAIPFCVDFKDRQINCLFKNNELFVSSADLKRESGKEFSFVTLPVLGMDKTEMKFTTLKTVEGEIPDPLFKLLSSISPEEGENALKETFTF